MSYFFVNYVVAYFLHHDLHLFNGKNNIFIMLSNFVLKAKNKTKNGRRMYVQKRLASLKTILSYYSVPRPSLKQ